MVRVRLIGLNKLKNLGNFNNGLDSIVQEAMFAEATVVLNESKKIVPYRTRALQTSGKVEKPVAKGGTYSVEVTYGGAAAPYAVYVHEIPKNYNHGRQWKYLETPALAHADKFSRKVKERIAAHILRRTKR